MILLPFIFFTLVSILAYKRAGYTSFVFVHNIYAFSSLFSIFYFYNDSFYNDVFFPIKGNISFMSIITYCFFIYLISTPLKKVTSVRLPSRPDILKKLDLLFKRLSYILIFGFICSIYFSYDGLTNFSLDNLAETRSEVYLGEGDEVKYNGLFHYLKIFVNYSSALWPLSIFLYFYYTKREKRLQCRLLILLTSFSNVLLNILIAGRTQIVYWILTFTAIYILFKGDLKKSDKNVFKILYIGILFIIMGYISTVTISRWGEDGAMDSVIEYLGQPFINYNYFFNEYLNKSLEFGRIFPLTSALFSDPFNLENYRADILISSGMNIGIFYTFLGDILVDIGHLGLFFYSLLIYIFYSLLIKKGANRYSDLSNFIVGLPLYLLLIQGIFYYPFWKVSGELFILVCLSMYIYIKNFYIK